MSQGEWNSYEVSIKWVFMVLLPYVLATLILSVVGYFQRHYRKEPFSIAKLLTGMTSDVMIGVFAACITAGLGFSHWFGVGVSMGLVSLGLRKTTEIALDIVYSRLGVDRRRKDEKKDGKTV